MVVHEITLTFSISPRSARWLLAAAFLALLPRVSSTQDTTVSTIDFYYPAPRGFMDYLETAGGATIGSVAGDVVVGSKNNAGGTYMAVGADQIDPAGSPKTTLRVYGTMEVDGCIYLQGTSNRWRCNF